MDEANATAKTDLPDQLEKRLVQIAGSQNLAVQRAQIESWAARHNISLLDCAAALLFLSQPQPASPPKPPESISAQYRFVRYRLDVGSQHQVMKDQIQAVLVEESGVDKKRIGKIDIRHNYTLVELPDGMPADVFQLLAEATLGGRKLAIKRIKPNRRGNKGQG